VVDVVVVGAAAAVHASVGEGQRGEDTVAGQRYQLATILATDGLGGAFGSGYGRPAHRCEQRAHHDSREYSLQSADEQSASSKRPRR
jgi:hypothetical protein